ncbi:MAG: adenosylcobinamide-GDP ribazoletransferase [Bacteroidota bacterium]|nr:adenosylcobinamide-GDP ribazoletransferase [Candidatus Kapabacteria bacterium]MDW8219884.1 adenosylcobinamide-GDP ribazoletransferase [Bacteroidota bacterium]
MHTFSRSRLFHELRVFFTALMFFTRLPCPSWVDHSEVYLNRSSRYFPLVGWIVGGCGASVLFVATLLLPIPIAVLLSMIATILLTGAFHEDGFADMCDGFGGGWSKEQILAIMQDSRLGTFGGCGLGLLLALKFACLCALAETYSILTCCFVLITAHAASRFTAVTFLRTHVYARSESDSKAKPLATTISIRGLLVAACTGFAPLALLWTTLTWKLMILLVPLVCTKWYIGRLCTRWIQGYTGDCLGATQQVSETAMYLTAVCIAQLP